MRRRICLRQVSIDDKSNEIPAVPVLLKLLELEGATVTLDAMHCQVETAKAIIDAGADYVLTAKGNQESLHQQLFELFSEYGEQNHQVEGLRKHVTVDKGHGREERREYYTIAAPDVKAFSRWPGLQSSRPMRSRIEPMKEMAYQPVEFPGLLPSASNAGIRRSR